MSNDKKPIDVCFYMTQKFTNNQVYTKCKKGSLNKCPAINFLNSIENRCKYKLTNKCTIVCDKAIYVMPVNNKVNDFYNSYVMKMIAGICNKCKKNKIR